MIVAATISHRKSAVLPFPAAVGASEATERACSPKDRQPRCRAKTCVREQCDGWTRWWLMNGSFVTMVVEGSDEWWCLMDDRHEWLSMGDISINHHPSTLTVEDQSWMIIMYWWMIILNGRSTSVIAMINHRMININDDHSFVNSWLIEHMNNVLMFNEWLMHRYRMVDSVWWNASV